MTKFIVALIRFYQVIISPLIHQLLGIAPGTGCRFDPTCSTYASNSIQSYGILRGSLLAVKRVLACQSLRK